MGDSKSFTIASNQGEFGGGEVMLIAIAEAARELGYEVTVVAPATPDEVLGTARERGFNVVSIPSKSRAQYLMNLKLWDLRHRKGLLWCNGLRPALATAGHQNRVVHLHQEPHGLTGKTTPLARLRSRATVVPSHYMARRVPGSVVLWNWTSVEPELRSTSKINPSSEPPVIGYMGRLSEGKGLKVLCAALNEVAANGHPIKLRLAGEPRFVTAAERDELENLLRDLKVTELDRRGWMERGEFFRSVDIAVFPSLAPESFGLVVAEAMAERCPFVISDAGALPEVADHNYPYISQAGDPHDLAQVLQRAMRDDWSQQVEASYTRWADNFTPSAGRRRLDDLLNSIKGL